MLLLELGFYPIVGDSNRFKVIVEDSPAGEANHEPTLPFWDGKDWRFTVVKSLEATEFRLTDFPEESEQAWMVQAGLLQEDRSGFHSSFLAAIGQQLYRTLCPPGSDLEQSFEISLSQARKARTPLHIRLKFPANTPKYVRLTDYPWELMHNGQGFLAQIGVTFSRYIAYRSSRPNLPAVSKLNVLLASSGAFDQEQGLQKLPKSERQAVVKGVQVAESQGRIRLFVLENPTMNELRTWLTEHHGETTPHVLHFDGHGFFGRRCNQELCRSPNKLNVKHCSVCGTALGEPQGYLLFEHDNRSADYISAQEIGELLGTTARSDNPGENRGVTVAVLSACRSGLSLRSDSIFNGVAQNLIGQGVPAVLAMQYSVSAAAATAFAEHFYRSIGQQDPLATACLCGQSAMGIEGNQWYRPVLYLRWQDNEGGQLFSSDAVSDQENPINEYRQGAAQLIGTSYVRSREIDEDCKKYLQELRSRLELPQEQAELIDKNILELCQASYENIQFNIEQYEQAVKNLISNNPSTSNEVRKKIRDLEVVYARVKPEVGSLMFTKIGNDLLQENQLEWAILCLEKAVSLDLERAEAYTSLATVLWKRDKLEKAIECLKAAKKIYDKQLAPEPQLAALEQAIKQLEQSLKRKQGVFSRLGEILRSKKSRTPM